MATTTVATGRKTIKDTTAADIVNISGDATAVTIAGRMTAGDIINIEGLASEYTVSASGRTITLKSATQTVTFQLSNTGGAASVRFLDGELSAKFATKGGATLGGVKLTKKPVDIDDSKLNESLDSAAVDFTGSTGGSTGGGTTTPTGTPYALTTGFDTPSSTAGNDTYSGVIDSWTILDAIDGGLGNDTLTVATTSTAAPTGATVANVETININTTGAGYTINSTTFTGLTALTVSAATQGAVSVTGATTTAAAVVATGTGTLTVIGTGGALTATAGTGNITIGGTAVANALTSVATSGGGVVAITDRSGTAAATGSTLKTVSITNATDDQTITANGLTTLNLSGLVGATTVGDTTITAAAGTRALTINLNGIDVGGDGAVTAGSLTVTDATATSVAINAVTSATYDSTVDVAAATSVTIDASAALTMDALTAGAATTVGISGGAAVTITADTLDAAVVITSTNTGGVTLTQALTANQQFVGTGSTGNDAISIGATTKVITTGAGNDSIISTGLDGTGGSVDAGDGTDNITMTSAQAEVADNNSTFNTKFTNFETLTISDTLSATADIDLAGINGVSKVVLAGGGGHASTALFRSFKNDGTLQLTADATGATALVTGALFSASNSINIELSKTGGVLAAGDLTTTGVETVKITTADVLSAGADTAAVIHTATLVDPQATSITVSGNNGLNLTNTGNTAVTSFNASGVVSNGALDTVANLGVTFVSANVTATATVSITGGAGTDTLTGVGALDVISGGAAADTITGGALADTLTGGAGADVFRYTTAATSVGAAGVNVDRITDFVAGTDDINLMGGGGAGGLLAGVTIAAGTGAVATMAAVVANTTSVATIADVYTALAAYTGLTASAADGTATVAQVYTFANGAAAGTYLVVNDSTAGFQAANDLVINLTGLSGTLTAADFVFTA